MIAQTTQIPDTNFEQALINLGYDTGTPDGVISTASIDTIKNLSVNVSDINDLTGIEDFASLSYLSCFNNYLTNVDLTQNTSLTYFNCAYNNITKLDVSQLCNITNLDCSGNLLTNLDVSKNAALIELFCYENQLSDLDVSQNTVLYDLQCSLNLLTILNLARNTSLGRLGCHHNMLQCLNIKNGNNTSFADSNWSNNFVTSNNPDLECVEVDDPIWFINNVSAIDMNITYSVNCNNDCSDDWIHTEEKDLNNITIYPNPTNGLIFISLTETKNNFTATIINNMGKTLFTKKYYATNFISIDMDLPKGVFFLQLEMNSAENIIMKVLKK